MRISGHTPLWIAARALLAGRVDDFFDRWRRAAETFDPEDIHDLRVSSRRLREGFLLFAAAYRPESVRRAARGVRKVTRLLGALRNTDEALVFFRRMAETAAGSAGRHLARIIARHEDLRREQRRQLRRGLRELDPRRTREALARIVASPALFSPPPSGIDPFTTIAAFAAERLRERLDDVLALVSDACREADVEAQHRLRIAVKHYRYRLEILSFLPGDAFAALHAAIKAYQDVLGTMHDLDVFAGMVRHEGLPSADECVILTNIAGERHRQFALFAGLLAETPFEAIGEQVRRAL